MSETLKIDKEFLKQRPLSQSSLKKFMRSPAHYIHYLTAPKEDIEAFVIGGAVDTLIFEPDKFEERFILAPECDRRTKDGKEIYARFEEQIGAKQILKQTQYDQCLKMKESFFKNPFSKKLYERCDSVQVKYNWTDKQTQLPLVTIIDAQGKDIILSLKTSVNADPDDFSRSAVNFGYYIQCAIELEACAKKGVFPAYYFAVIEKTAPYCTSVMKADDEFIEYGKKILRKLLDEFKYCMGSNLFETGYEFRSAVGYTQLELPGWLKYKLKQL